MKFLIARRHRRSKRRRGEIGFNWPNVHVNRVFCLCIYRERDGAQTKFQNVPFGTQVFLSLSFINNGMMLQCEEVGKGSY